MTDKIFYITTPLYYVNDELHIGHATTTLYADTMARFKRLDGYDVRFLTGSDEHGQKIFKAAAKQNITPKQLADRIVGKFLDVWEVMGIEYDQFIRTTDPYHETTVKALFGQIQSNELIYKGTYRALYCTDCEQAYSPSMLVDGKCPIHKTEPVHLDEENYFFSLSKFTQLLRLRLDDEKMSDAERTEAQGFADALGLKITPDASSITPESRRNEVLGKLREGLEDTSISRTAFDWGVGMPGDEKHVIWVWFDALINYVSALMKPAVEALGEDAQPSLAELRDNADFQRYWPEVHHLIGKDILWHHSVVWWSMLLAASIQPPASVFAHGWWTVEGDKMSKTLGNVIKPGEVVEKYGRDQLRYFVLLEGPAKGDADWRHERFIGALNGELAGTLGNLLSRTLGMSGKYHDGVVPEPDANASGVTGEGAADLEAIAKALPEKLRARIDAYDFTGALGDIFALANRANKYIDDTKPFKLAKDESDEAKAELAHVMHALFQTLRVLSGVLIPFLPEAAPRMREQLGLSEVPATLDSTCGWSASYPGTQTTKGEGLFPRIDE